MRSRLCAHSQLRGWTGHPQSACPDGWRCMSRHCGIRREGATMTAGVRGVLPMVAAVLWQHSYAVPGLITVRTLIASELGVATGLLIAPVYLILYASLLLLDGRLADLLGPRRVLISSL